MTTSPPPSRRRRLLRRLGYVTIAVAVLLVVGGFLLGRALQGSVGAEHVETLINEALRDATGGLYRVSLEEIEWGLGGMSLRLTGLSLMLDREVLAARDAAGTTPELLFQLQHATVDLTGVDPWSLLRRRGFRAVSLSIDQPLIQLSGLDQILGLDSPRRSGASADEAPAAAPGTPLSQEQPEQRADELEREAPMLQIWNLSVRGAALESYRRAGAVTSESTVADAFSLFERLEGVDIEIDDLDLGETATDAPRFLFADDLAIRIARYTYIWPDGLHEEAHGPISLSTRDGYLRVEDFNVRPTFDRRDRVGADGSVPHRVEVHIDEVALEGLDFADLIARRALAGRELRLAGATATVISDPPAPASAGESGAVGSRVDAVTEPITRARPGALLTEALSGLPAISLQRVSVERMSGRVLVDRDGDEWLDEPRVQHELSGFELQLEGYRSSPDMAYDPSRPFLADRASLQADRVVTTLPRQRYRLEMEQWSMADRPGQVAVASLRIVPLFDRRALAAAGEPLVDRYEVDVSEFRLDRVDFGSLIDEVDVVIGEMSLGSASVSGLVSHEGSDQEPAPTVRSDRAPGQTLAEAVLGLPDIRIDAVRLDNIDYETRIDRDPDGWLRAPRRHMSLDGLHLTLEDLEHDPETGYDIERPLLARSGELGADAFRLVLGDGFSELAITDVLLTTVGTRGTLGGLSIAPVDPDPDGLRTRLRTATVPRVTAGPLSFTGTPLGDFLETGQILLPTLTLASFRAEILEASDRERSAAETEGDRNTRSLLETVRALPVLKLGSLRITDAHFSRHVAPADSDWSELPAPTESITGLSLELDGVDTGAAGEDRLLFSDRVAVSLDGMQLAMGQAGATLRVADVALSSDSDTLTIGGAAYSTREVGGNDDFTIGRIELTNVPYGRTFRALIEPPATGTPILSAMIDRGTDLRIAGVEGSLDGARRALRVGTIEGSARDGGLRIAGIDLRPTLPDADPSTPGTEFDQAQTLLSFADIRAEGVDFPRFAAEGVLRASRLSVDAPRVVLVTGLRDGDAAGAAADPGAPAPASGPADGPVLSERIADGVRGLPAIRIAQVRLTNIGFEERRSLEGRPVRDFESIQLAIDGLDLRHDRDPAAPEGVLYADDIRIDVPRQKTWVDNVGYEIAAGPISLSTGAGTLDLGRVEYLPPATKDQYLARTRVIESDRMEISAGRVALSGIDFARLLREEGLYAGGATIADWSVDILHDKKKPKNPHKREGPASYPNEAVQRMGLRFGIDRLDLAGGAVRYSERDEEGDRPGELWWDRLAGSITNLTNDPRLSSLETPTVLAVEARMLDQAYLKLTWNLPLLEPGPTMSYSGEIGPLDVTRLSSILEPLEGVRISEGVFDRTWFDVDVRDRRATGTFNALYRDVKIQLVDRNTGGRNLGQRILSFAANVILPSNNTDRKGEPERVGRIDWQVPDDKPFFGVFWDAVKQGVIDVAR